MSSHVISMSATAVQGNVTSSPTRKAISGMGCRVIRGAKLADTEARLTTAMHQKAYDHCKCIVIEPFHESFIKNAPDLTNPNFM